MTTRVQREPFYKNMEGIPFPMQFLEREVSIPMPTFDEAAQMHRVSESPRDAITILLTTASPNHRDAV